MSGSCNEDAPSGRKGANCSCSMLDKLAISSESICGCQRCEVKTMENLDQEKKEYIKPEIQVIDICTSEILGDSEGP